MRVDDIMVEEVTTVELGSGVADCAQTMLHGGVRSVVVMADGGPTGIVAKSDALHAGVASGKPLPTIPTRAVISSPIKWIRPGSTTCMVAEKIRENRMKKLIVVDGSEIVGIVTATDIAFHLSDMTRDVGQMIELKNKWKSDRRFR